MGWSLRLGRVAGIDLRVHVTFLLLLAWIAAAHHLQGGPGAAARGVLFTLAVFGCVVLHEFGHALAARRYGIPTPDITLLPIGGVARLARMPEDPRQEIVIALAGPAVNVAIAAVLWLAGVDFGSAGLFRLESEQGAVSDKLLVVNVFLVLFNLLPAFPMDGGRVLRAFLALRLNYVRATQVVATVGQGFAFLFGFFGLLSNPVLLLVALFVYVGAVQEAALVQMRNITARLPVVAAMRRNLRVLPLHASVHDASAILLDTAQHEFPLVDEVGRLRGVATRDAVVSALARGQAGPIAAIAHTDVRALSWRAPLDEAFMLMAECRCPALAVLDDDGRLAGLVTPESVGEMLMVHDALGKRRLTPAA
jgi:Zn-dependent protease/CBS domain-containing protein